MDLLSSCFSTNSYLGDWERTLICTIARRASAQEIRFCQILSAALLCTIYSSLCSVIVTPCSLMQFLYVISMELNKPRSF